MSIVFLRDHPVQGAMRSGLVIIISPPFKAVSNPSQGQMPDFLVIFAKNISMFHPQCSQAATTTMPAPMSNAPSQNRARSLSPKNTSAPVGTST